MSFNLDVIKERIDMAEWAAIHVADHSSMWMRYYEDTAKTNLLINDFKAMVREIEKMRGIIFSLECKCEAAGIKLEDENGLGE
jgi:hypothetical protein